MTTRAFRQKICGYDVPVVNGPPYLAVELEEMCQGEPFAAIFWIDGDSITFSLRSSEIGGIDVADVARLFGGGGHARAAGFKLPYFHLFDLRPGVEITATQGYGVHSDADVVEINTGRAER